MPDPSRAATKHTQLNGAIALAQLGTAFRILVLYVLLASSNNHGVHRKITISGGLLFRPALAAGMLIALATTAFGRELAESQERPLYSAFKYDSALSTSSQREAAKAVAAIDSLNALLRPILAMKTPLRVVERKCAAPGDDHFDRSRGYIELCEETGAWIRAEYRLISGDSTPIALVEDQALRMVLLHELAVALATQQHRANRDSDLYRSADELWGLLSIESKAVEPEEGLLLLRSFVVGEEDWTFFGHNGPSAWPAQVLACFEAGSTRSRGASPQQARRSVYVPADTTRTGQFASQQRIEECELNYHTVLSRWRRRLGSTWQGTVRQ